MDTPILDINATAFDFFDREQRSKVLKEALLLFLLAWNQVQKMLYIEQKLFMGTKNVPKWNWIAMYGITPVYGPHILL